ncbi:MAG: MBL fold metallo-hydrolase [Candidatus Woesearchaeota archaeon]|nr:MBL fold metallo-hydrolase [Candidatus Woesearchaeota archaeon]
MQVSVFASGSTGNCTFIDTGETKILVDAGIALRRIKKHLSDVGSELKEIDGVFITHEHNDHIRGLLKLDKEIDKPVFLRPGAYAGYGMLLSNYVPMKDKTSLNDLEVEAVPISHDAADPVGFDIFDKMGKKQLSMFTDLGKYDDRIKKSVATADALVLETNHDVDMLINGKYPYDLKQRILGDKGHLSNIDASVLVRDNHSEKLKNVFLAHISKNNNTKQLALDTFMTVTGKSRFNSILTDQITITELLKI